LQKRRIILSILLTEATPQESIARSPAPCRLLSIYFSRDILVYRYVNRSLSHDSLHPADSYYIYLSMYISIHISIHLYIYLCIYPSIYLSIYLSMISCPLHTPIYISTYVYIYISIYISHDILTPADFYLYISISIYLYIYISMYLHIYRAIS